ncbi:MAG: carbohydrate ABC transporter permease [Gammaproteobacteria bacterium]
MNRISKSLLYWLLLAPLIALILFPFALMLSTALKPPDEVLTYPPAWLPSRLQWRNFVDMWQATRFGTALLNSCYVSLAASAGAIAVSIPAAYALSRYEFHGKSLYRQFLLMTQMLSPLVLVLGLFRLAAGLGLLNSVNSLVLIYASFNIAFAVWMLHSYFATIPRDLEEAAWLDGASRARALRSVFLPLAVPALGVTAIFTFINSWNEFLLALTLLRSESNYTLPIQIFALVAGRYTIEWHHVMAATLLATLPVAIVFAWLQRYLVKGLALGAVR